MQIYLAGILSYQVVSHRRSVLLTQIWAYRCQNGRMQIVYLAHITYHFYYNSDLYLLGLATGTLTGESITNLTCCFFAFSYSLVNMIKGVQGISKLIDTFDSRGGYCSWAVRSVWGRSCSGVGQYSILLYCKG
jgi:hypothetical protein